MSENLVEVRVKIIQARHLQIEANSNTCIEVHIGGQSKTTRTAKFSDSPFFNEYFVFEFTNEDFNKFLDHSVEIQVKSWRGILSRSQTVAEFTISLHDVYNQSSHQIFRKWAPLLHPKHLNAGNQGYIKCDICIQRAGEIVDQPLQVENEDEDIIEENLICGEAGIRIDQRQFAEYSITVHSADDLVAVGKQKLNPQISVAISDLKGLTSVKKQIRKPVWNETMSFIDYYPPMWNQIRVHLINSSKLSSKILAEHCISVDQISNFSPNDEFPPDFGPAFIHMYSAAKVYQGRILLRIQTHVLQDTFMDKSRIRKMQVTQNDASSVEVPSKNMELFCTVLEATLQGAKVGKKKCRLEVALAPPNSIEKIDVTAPIGCSKGDEGFVSLDISKTVPCLKVNSNWPDRRFSMFYSNQVLSGIKTLRRATCPGADQALQTASNMFQTILKMWQNKISDDENITNLDHHRLKRNQQIVTWALNEIETALQKKHVDKDFIDNICVQLLLCTVDPQQHGVPDVSVRLLSSDGCLIGDHKVPVQQIICSANPLEAGQLVMKPITVFLQKRLIKNDKKGWNSISKAKLRLLMWFGQSSQIAQLLQKLPNASNVTDKIPMMMNFTEKMLFECQIQIYHGNLVAGWNINTLANPFLRISIGSKAILSGVRKDTLAPVWNEAIVLWPIIVWGTSLSESPPLIDFELFDEELGKPAEFVGRCTVTPFVADFTPAEISPKWYALKRGAKNTANILATFQTIKKWENESPSALQLAPLEMSDYRVQCLMWALESGHQLSNPLVTVEFGGVKIGSGSFMQFDHYSHFNRPVATLVLSLPSNPLYFPPVVIKLFCQKSGLEFEAICVVTTSANFLQQRASLDCTAAEPVVVSLPKPKNGVDQDVSIGEEVKEDIEENDEKSGSATDDESESSFTTPLLQKYNRTVKAVRRSSLLTTAYKKFKEMLPEKSAAENTDKKEAITALELDWWSKFYASDQKADQDVQNERVTLKLYNGALEDQQEFGKFSDLVQSYSLVSGLRHTEEEPETKATFLGSFNIVPICENQTHDQMRLPAYLTKHQSLVIARIYIVRALRLCPKDKNGLSDPYIVISNDSRVLCKDRDNFVSENLNPVFGKCFELKLSLPVDHSIKISVFDRNETLSDNLIGETTIDLEKRLMSKHRAHCGFSQQHNLHGYNTWRDGETPTGILCDLCSTHKIEAPEFQDWNLKVGNIEIKGYEGISKEQLALEALKRWKTIAGWELVPEHVESRPLFSPKKPGVEQGRLQMWVDLFPTFGAAPGPKVNIAPRAPEDYELRVTVWMAEEVPLEDTNLAGTKMSDIYFRGWLGEDGKKQSTDIHHRSLTGEGLFNWRFIFPFKYLPSEHCILVQHTGFSSLFSTGKQLVPCTFNIQAWDADIITADDFLSSTSLDLSKLPRGAKTSMLCNTSNQSHDFVNLFLAKKTRGWWQLHNCKGHPAGKVELEFELLTKSEADANQAGKGRSPPNELPSPKRPDTSFLWLVNPARAARVVLWRSYGRKIIVFLLIGLVLAFLIYAVLSIPTVVLHEMISKIIR